MLLAAVIFKCIQFPLVFPDDPDRQAPPGRELTEFFCVQLREVVGAAFVGAVEEADDGWDINFSYEGKKYSLFFHWASREDEFWWVIRIFYNISILESLFRSKRNRKSHNAALTYITQQIDNVFNTTSGIRDVIWMDEVEFIDFYTK